MVIQLLVSGMQHHRCGRLELAGAAKLCVQCFPGTLKQQIVKCGAVAQDQARQFVRQGEDDLEVRHTWQEDFGGLVHPVRSPGPAALGAVSIGARVVDVLLPTAVGALIKMPSQSCCAAQPDLGEDTFDLRVDAVLAEVARGPLAQ